METNYDHNEMNILKNIIKSEYIEYFKDWLRTSSEKERRGL